MESHAAAVSAIASRVRDFYDRKEAFRIYHGSTNSTRDSKFTRDTIIDTSGLNNVLRIDPEKKIVVVEPNVPMDKLVSATLPLGLIPPVVMEFPGITAGGAFSGTSGESSSFRYGFFDRIVSKVEIVLATGEVVTASENEKSDLFRGSAASFGTLGVITMLELQLVESKPYVQLTYHKLTSIPQAMKKMEDETMLESNDYVDGIILAKDSIVICTGRLSNGPTEGDFQIQRFNRPKDPWFYLHATRITSRTSSGDFVTELVPLADYLFRYDRGGFWASKYAFTYFITPFNRITRRLLDKFMRTRVLYHALHKSGFSSKYIIQDVAVPYTAADEFVSWIEDNFGHYPLWLCPLRQRGRAEGSAHGLLAESPDANAPEFLMNFGIWGPGPKDRRDFIEVNRRLEQKVQELGGRKWLYAHAYYTEDEFWSIYDKKAYDALRSKYGASYLPSIYDKVKVDVAKEESAAQKSWLSRLMAVFWSIWPLAGLYGVYKAFLGGDYLLPKQRFWTNRTTKED